MRAPHLVDLALLAEPEAERRHFDAKNYRAARFVWYLFTLLSVVAVLVSFFEDLAPQLFAALGNLLALLAIARFRARFFLHPRFALYLGVAIALESVLFVLLPEPLPLAVGYGCAVVPFLLLLLRFRFLDGALVVAAVAVAVAAHAWLRPAPVGEEGDGPPIAVAIFGVALAGLSAAALGASITRRRRVELFAELDRARGDARERLRMREELESARAIQLAMLPSQPPPSSWLDLAAACIPATEVGGDYYDYFDLGTDRRIVAIGDVAGHGVAAGIVLSGVRAGLHLLAEDLDRPAEVLDRLNRLVRETGPERLLMTLGLALLDRATGRLTWTSAGQPPALRFDARRGEVRAAVGTQPPLGTRLPVRYESLEDSLEPGDVWIFVSDGALEARDPGGEPFGETRLAEALAAAARETPDAAGARDLVLASIARHRAGAELDDDLTIVVARRSAR